MGRSWENREKLGIFHEFQCRRHKGPQRISNALANNRSLIAGAFPSFAGGSVFAAFLALSLFATIFAAVQFSDGLLSFPGDRSDAAMSEDLVAFHRAGELALQGDAAGAYNPAVFSAPFDESRKGLLWLNPPHANFIVAPLALLPYGAAKALWIGLSALSLITILRIADIRSPLLVSLAALSPAMLTSTMLLQVGAFVAAGLLFAFTHAQRRPMLAGFVFALLTMKPQFGVMAPFFLIAVGAWRAIGWAIVCTLLMTAASAAVFGIESWKAFFGALGTVHPALAYQIMPGTATIAQTVAKFGGGDMARATAQIAGAALCAFATWTAARKLALQDAIALTLLASLAAAPYAWIYDWPIALAALLLLFRRENWPLRLQCAGGALWAAPLAPIYLKGTVAGVAPAIALYLTFAVAAVMLFARGKAEK